jgi:membrane-bound serine protease (ClpP class)
MDALTNEPFISGLFLVAGFICLVLEVFIPTGGVLGLLSLGSTIFGIYGLFHQGQTLLAVLSIAFFLASFWGGFRFMVRRLKFPVALTPDTTTSVDRRIADLVGRQGLTLTPLRPAGMALIDGRKVDVVTPGDFVEKNVQIRVVDNSGNRVVVRQVETGSPKS